MLIALDPHGIDFTYPTKFKIRSDEFIDQACMPRESPGNCALFDLSTPPPSPSSPSRSSLSGLEPDGGGAVAAGNAL